jgi:hypothetical protein
MFRLAASNLPIHLSVPFLAFHSLLVLTVYLFTLNRISDGHSLVHFSETFHLDLWARFAPNVGPSRHEREGI